MIAKEYGAYMPTCEYSELSNFSLWKNSKKVTLDISIVLIIDEKSEPLDTMNSIYNKLVSKFEGRMEFVIINSRNAPYKYEKLLETFPLMRVIFPKESLNLKDSIMLAISESAAKNILFISEDFIIKDINYDILSMYINEPQYGIIIPLIENKEGEVIPNIVKAHADNGFVNTISMDIIGTAILSLYPKYQIFFLNRNAFLERNITIADYENKEYIFLELGYKLWKEGFLIMQCRDFKVVSKSAPVNDIAPDFASEDYLKFNITNLKDRNLKNKRFPLILLNIFIFLFTFRINRVKFIIELLKKRAPEIEEIKNKPISDIGIFSMINRDLK